jgi:hypothetical protein
MANDPPFATLNHFAADLGIPSESDLLRIGIIPYLPFIILACAAVTAVWHIEFYW